MHATSLDSDDDIDAVFASGNTMDEQLMQRVFMRIIQRASKPLSLVSEPVNRVVGWLNQLRSVDGGNGVFDKLVRSYLQSSFKGEAEGSFSIAAVANLAVSESVSLSTVAGFAKDVSTPLADSALKMFISTETLDLGLNQCEQYRFRLQQDQCQAEQPDSLITLVRKACDVPSFHAEDPDLIRFIIRCVSTKPGSVRQVFVEGGDHSRTLRMNASHIVSYILQLGQGGRATNVPMKEFDVKALVRMANTFSVRYCLEAIRYLKTKANWSPDDEAVLEESILESFNNGSDIWAQVLEFAGERINAAIYAWAQDQLLHMAADKSGLKDEGAHAHLKRCLELLAVTSRTANKGEDIAVVGTITEKLKEVEANLSHFSDMDSEPKSALSSVLKPMQIMLHLSVMHIHAVPNENDASKHARTNLLGTLCSLLVHPKLQLHQDVAEYLFDLASTLSDSLAEATDSTVKLPQGLILPQDPRLEFILDNDLSAVETWLLLAYQDRPQGSQQQRALAKHPSSQQSQQQLGGRLPSSQPQQRSPTHAQHQRWPSSSSQPSSMRQDSRLMPEIKTTPYQLRRWEIFSDPTPVMGENDGSVSLALFGARKV
jgi:mediator of RNA polymerase II transcription subunit 12